MQKSMYSDSKVVLSDADPAWPKMFADEKQRILFSCKLRLAVEHVGSTSIPNMIAKPTVDMLVGTAVPSDIDAVLQTMLSIGYVLEGRRNDGRHSWLSCPSPKERQYIIHLVVVDDDEWNKRISFRDYLRSHAETASEYKELKRVLARKHSDDLAMYTSEKASFVADVITVTSRTIPC